MTKRIEILIGLVAICSACLISTEVRAQTAETSNNLALEIQVAHLAVNGAPAGAITKGRAQSLVGTAMGLISVVIGGIALARSARTTRGNNGRVAVVAGLVIGLIGMVLSVVHLATSTGGFGTGSGRAGAIVGLVLGLIGVNLGGLVLVRSRRSRSTQPEVSGKR